MKRNVKSRHGSLSNEDAKIVSNHLRESFPDGYVTKEKVLELARPKNSLLHRFFEWDNTKAAERWRLFQARQLINCLVVEVNGTRVREYTQPVVIEGISRKQFVEIDIARKSKDVWKQVLEIAIRDAISWKNRYEHLKELSPIVGAIVKVEKKITKQGVSE